MPQLKVWSISRSFIFDKSWIYLKILGIFRERKSILADKLSEDFHEHKEDITTLLLALQKQNFVLGNSLSNLVTKWSTLQHDALILSLAQLERLE